MNNDIIIGQNCCANCKFAKPIEDKNLQSQGFDFFCHRYPPTIAAHMIALPQNGRAPQFYPTQDHPMMPAGEWCGEWQKKILVGH